MRGGIKEEEQRLHHPMGGTTRRARGHRRVGKGGSSRRVRGKERMGASGGCAQRKRGRVVTVQGGNKKWPGGNGHGFGFLA